MILTVLLLVYLHSVMSVRYCYFCADLERICNETLRVRNGPPEMDCDTFLINANPPTQLWVHPDFAQFPADKKDAINWINVWSLPQRTPKTLCFTLRFEYTNGGESPMVISSCAYQDFEGLNKTCDFMEKQVFIDRFKLRSLGCKMCATRRCNSGNVHSNFIISHKECICSIVISLFLIHLMR